MTTITLATIKPAGMNHYVPASIAEEMISGDHIELKPEPDNKFDNQAIKVIWNSAVVEGAHEVHIGYIPKPLNQAIWALIHAHIRVTAEILEDNSPVFIIRAVICSCQE